MSFLFGNSVKADRPPSARAEARSLRADVPQADIDRFYSDLIARRPALLDEKLKLHGRIVDEFNLALAGEAFARRAASASAGLYRTIMSAPSASRSTKRSSTSSPAK